MPSPGCSGEAGATGVGAGRQTLAASRKHPSPGQVLCCGSGLRGAPRAWPSSVSFCSLGAGHAALGWHEAFEGIRPEEEKGLCQRGGTALPLANLPGLQGWAGQGRHLPPPIRGITRNP